MSEITFQMIIDLLFEWYLRYRTSYIYLILECIFSLKSLIIYLHIFAIQENVFIEFDHR